MRVVLVAIGIILRERQVLICQRVGKDAFSGLWEFPGGKVEAGESPAAALLRELREELDVDVELTGELTSIEHEYAHARVQLMPYLCRLTSGVPRPLASARLEWVDVQRLRDYPFPAANSRLIEQVIAHLGISPGCA